MARLQKALKAEQQKILTPRRENTSLSSDSESHTKRLNEKLAQAEERIRELEKSLWRARSMVDGVKQTIADSGDVEALNALWKLVDVVYEEALW